MATSCSHWWHCPVYFAMSVTLAVVAISASIHSTAPNNNTTPSNPLNQSITHNLSFKASIALRKRGFNAIATLLQINPELFLLSSSPQSTIFAIQDSAISSLSAHPKVLKRLLNYHTSPSALTLQDLLKKPQGTCLPTLVRKKNIAITRIDAERRSIEINSVLISHPDLFLEGPLSIHGVLGLFSPLDLHDDDNDQDWEITQPPVCDSSYSVASNATQSKNAVEWNQMVRLLSANGFVSFSIGLHSVLEGVLQDHPDLDSVTIFAPLDFVFVASSWPLLNRTVRFHMLPRRTTYAELSSLPARASLGTMVPGRDLVVTTIARSKQLVAINGVVITKPDTFSSKYFVIHGISRAFSMEEPSSMFIEVGKMLSTSWIRA